MAVQVFMSYSHKDAASLKRLRVHLVPLEREGVTFWYDDDVVPGEELTPRIRREMRRAQVFVALASPDYIASDYCFNKEYLPAMRRAARKTLYVLVAVIKQCGWKHSRMSRYKLLPRDGKAVHDWPKREHGYEDVVDGIRRVVSVVTAGSAPTVGPTVRVSRTKTVAKRPAKSGVTPAKAAATRKPSRKSSGKVAGVARPRADKPALKKPAQRPVKPNGRGRRTTA